ncbi:MAG: ParB N-terminal domain-containing protein [Achromobacter xylosoxidans]
MKVDHNELAAVHAAGIRLDIPYAKLRISTTYQARRAQDQKHDPEILELKATIKAIGFLLQNLVVVACADGCYEVCAGGRRWTAVGLLIEEGSFSEDYIVPCLVIPSEYAHHASLIENIGRKAMHPADTYMAYARLRDDGWTIEAIAAAHGANEPAVKRLLALGGVAPSLMQLFRDGEIDVSEMQALASVSDHARQEAAWKSAKREVWNRDQHIRDVLAQTEMQGTDAVARYVTVAAYEKAGGDVRRDLFEEDVYLTDPEKVREMALAKMGRSKLAKAVQAEGWGWVEHRVSFGYGERKGFGEIQRSHQEPDKGQEKQIKALEKKVADTQAEIESLDDLAEANHAKLTKLNASVKGWRGQIAEIRQSLYDYPAELKPLAGVVLHLDGYGDLCASRGLIRQEDREAVAKMIRVQSGGVGTPGAVDLPPVKTRPVHSEALTNRLQVQRVIALQAEIIVRPNLALCLLVEQMLGDIEWDRRGVHGDTFDFSAQSAHHELSNTDPDVKESAAWSTVQEQIQIAMKGVPKEDGAVLPWLLTQSQADVIALLAVLISVTVYRRRGNGYGAETKHLDRLSSIVDLDMGKWWRPTVQSYLGHVSKDRIAAVVSEAVGAEQAEGLLTMKKAEAAAAAEELLADTRWVPELMRTRPLPADAGIAVEHDLGEQ